jgi:TonB family protein
MNQLFPYLLQSAAGLLLFYICFLLVLRKEAYFRFNRFYLIGAVILSSTLPIISFNVVELLSRTSEEAATIYLSYQVTAYQLNEVVVGSAPLETSAFSFMHVLLAVYLAGVSFKAAQLLYRTTMLIRFASRCEHIRAGKLIFVITEAETPTFSFLNYIFISRALFENKHEFNAIIQHENVHSRQLHSVDLIFAEIMLIIQWFNPIAYLIRNYIKENHEFLADNQVIETTGHTENYQALLIAHSSPVLTNILTHNFSYSLIKRRLHMMKKPRNPFRFGLGLVGVILTSLVVIMACSRSDRGLTDQNTDHKSLTDSTYTVVDNMPEFPGGMDSLVGYLSRSILYPAEAKDNEVTGKVVVGFVIDKDGSVRDVHVVKGIGYGCDKEAQRVIAEMPPWTPGSHEGRAVKVSYMIPITFNLDDNESKEEPFTVVEQMPEYPGGVDALVRFISENIRYPEEAKRDSITGRVFVKFVVDTDGRVSDIGILRGIGSGCDEEAMRVVASMPKWKPGMHEGKPARVAYNLPIKFALD